MSPVTLTKKQILMDRRLGAGTHVVFLAADDPDTGIAGSQVDYRYEDWEAMGSPEVVTLTIEPGDRLNPPAEG